VSLFSLLLGGLRGGLGCGNDEHDPSGLDVPEHFREPEFLGRDDNGWLSWVIRLIGVHLFRFRLLTGVGRREASPLPGHSAGIPPFRHLAFHCCGERSPPGPQANITVRYHGEISRLRERPRPHDSTRAGVPQCNGSATAMQRQCNAVLTRPARATAGTRPRSTSTASVALRAQARGPVDVDERHPAW
jgi:hypothetical protein